MATKQRDMTRSGNGKGSAGTPEVKSVPYLGRSVRIVGDVEPFEPQENPHAKNRRGELGPALFNYYFNTPSRDPLGRIGTPTHSADRRNVLNTVVGRASREGSINPERLEVKDPAAMSRHLKAVAAYLGAHGMGIARANKAYFHAGGRPVNDGGGEGGAGSQQDVGDPVELAERYPYIIVCYHAWDYELIQAHRHHMGDAAYHFSQQQIQLVYTNLANYIKELGYSVLPGCVSPVASAVAAGLGELGRHGMVITEKHGSRINTGRPFLTDLPLVPDEPADIGVEDFCKICRKCATTCPTNSISMGDKVVHNGVEKYKINWQTCYRLRPYVIDHWQSCLTCVTVCPYTTRDTWWRTLAVQSLKRTPIPLRPPVVHTLKWLNERIWGKVPRRRVRWMGYDSGELPTTHGKGVTAIPPGLPPQDGKTGYYIPLRENTRRFELKKAREKAKK